MFLLYGYLIGLGTVIFIGPVVFTLLKATWQYGKRAGIMVATGIIVSDIFVVALCYLLTVFSTTQLTKFFENHANNKLYEYYARLTSVVSPTVIVGILGISLLLALAIKYILQPGSSLMATVTTKADHPMAFFTRGVMINTLNPSVFVVWVTIIKWAMQYKDIGPGNRLIGFLIAAQFGIFSMDMAKVFTAETIKPYMTPGILNNIYRGIGGLLIGFALLMLWKITHQA